jgi:hypothetical protein
MNNHKNNNRDGMSAKGGARPMKVVIDNHGYEWLCDKHVDDSGDFVSQGCWRTDQMSFDRNF